MHSHDLHELVVGVVGSDLMVYVGLNHYRKYPEHFHLVNLKTKEQATVYLDKPEFLHNSLSLTEQQKKELMEFLPQPHRLSHEEGSSTNWGLIQLLAEGFPTGSQPEDEPRDFDSVPIPDYTQLP